jgi:hypothetical protein
MDHSRLRIDVGFIPGAANNVPCEGRGGDVTRRCKTDLSVRLKISNRGTAYRLFQGEPAAALLVVDDDQLIDETVLRS